MKQYRWMANTAVCRCANDGTGCGRFWVEWAGEVKDVCPECGLDTWRGNIIVNPKGHPNVIKLNDNRVLVVFFEEAVEC